MTVLDIVKNNEQINHEYKLSYNNLPNSLFETVCSFLNRNGGHILLGV